MLAPSPPSQFRPRSAPTHPRRPSPSPIPPPPLPPCPPPSPPTPPFRLPPPPHNPPHPPPHPARPAAQVLEVRPRVAWDKGAALAHLLEMLGLADPSAVFALYIGDDRTDEDAFQGGWVVGWGGVGGSGLGLGPHRRGRVPGLGPGCGAGLSAQGWGLGPPTVRVRPLRPAR